MATWQQCMLLDEKSKFLRDVNELSRTSFLRAKKIQQLVRTLESLEDEDDAALSKMLPRVQQLLSMAAVQTLDSGIQDVIGSCEEALRQAADAELTGQRELQRPQQAVEVLRGALELLDSRADDVYDEQIVAEMELKALEDDMLKQWTEKKSNYERAWKRQCAMLGTRHALEMALGRVNQLSEGANACGSNAGSAGVNAGDAAAVGQGSACGCAGGGPLLDSQGGASTKDASTTWPGSEHKASPGVLDKVPAADAADLDPAMGISTEHCGDGIADHSRAPLVLSDYLAEGVVDPKVREDVLKQYHPGSKDHPHGCRACHFQGGLCWKGLECSFCHICPKPKRKSKHQRDVDRRRQERYRQVKDNLGVRCLDDLTKIDDSRRQMMAITEEIKKQVKDAYANGDECEIEKVRQNVLHVQAASDSCRDMVPVDPSAVLAEGGEQVAKEAEEEDELEKEDCGQLHVHEDDAGVWPSSSAGFVWTGGGDMGWSDWTGGGYAKTTDSWHYAAGNYYGDMTSSHH